MKYTNKFGIPKALEDIITSGYDLSKSSLDRVGITTLINPPIQRILTVNHWNGTKVKCDCCDGTGKIKQK